MHTRSESGMARQMECESGLKEVFELGTGRVGEKHDPKGPNNG